ncbi:unnamed protein product [Oikopleura dioica]|uniref:Uncharacterized protein n=1 Tax=Oikopleura dioica TaxID=34765 RepID=E4X320_OIKDI|nr:unnamed protein product [Oikopleura dioica]CBY35970.1 unnamed protein product [Oikopleura dioica]
MIKKVFFVILLFEQITAQFLGCTSAQFSVLKYIKSCQTSRTCVDMRSVCDCEKDCPGGEDELNCPSEIITLLENLGKTCSVAPESDICDEFKESSDCECRGLDGGELECFANNKCRTRTTCCPDPSYFYCHPTSVTEYSQARCLPKEIACNSDLLRLMTDCRNAPSEQYNATYCQEEPEEIFCAVDEVCSVQAQIDKETSSAPNFAIACYLLLISFFAFIF